MKILVFGSNGQLGRCLNDQLTNTAYEVVYASRKQIDIADFEKTKNCILDLSPEVVINAAAYTAVDRAEENPEQADLINHLAVKNIADTCSKINCWLFHISTDYVFDGIARAPYKEKDQTDPQGVYGLTKLIGELAIKASGCKYIIIRTSWVFSEYGNNFLKTMLRLSAERDKLSIVDDQVGCPTYAQDIAKVIVTILSQLSSNQTSDLYHYCGDYSCSWYGFASIIFQEAKSLNLLDRYPELVITKSKEFPSRFKRPDYSVLCCSKISNRFDVNPCDWRGAISTVLKCIYG